MTYKNADEMLGELVVERFADYGDKSVSVEKSDGEYEIHVAGRELRADCINMNGSAAGLSNDSYLHLGGDRDKRVTITKTPAGDRYAYVEVGQ